MGSDANDFFGTLTQTWLEMTARAMQAWQPAEGSTASPEMFRQGRADLLQVWSDWTQELMRSSLFLQAQKQCASAGLAAAKQVRSNLRQMQIELQIAGREDIDALMAAVQRSQRRVLDQLDETAARMQSLEAKLDGLSERIQRFMDREAGATGQENGAGGRKKPQYEARD